MRGVTIAELEQSLEKLGLPSQREVTKNGDPVLRSAVGGLTFNVRPGGVLEGVDEATRYGDFSYNLMFQLEREMDVGLLNLWNQQKRFGRLFQRDGFLIMEMDHLAVALGGDQILGSLEIWGRLVVDVLNFLRTAHAPTTTPN